MINSAIIIKVKQRLNKLDSADYDNIQDWQIVEAFNKGQVDWCRRNLHGLNIVKEGDEQSTRRVDDLEKLLTTLSLPPSNKQTYFEVDKPTDYLQWKRLSVEATNDCCKDPKPMVVYLAEEANIDLLLRDKNKKPSFEWGETFVTQEGGKIKVYTNGEFDISSIKLTYYKQPLRIRVTGIMDIYTNTIPATDTPSEFKDDLVELFIDEAVKIIAGDIEAINQLQRGSQAVENNN